MKKRLLALFLTFAMLLTLLPTAVLADDMGELTYEEALPDEASDYGEFYHGEELTSPETEEVATLEEDGDYDTAVTDSASAAAETTAASSGTCGDNLTWTLDDEGTLTISGTGPMTDYDSDNYVPWYSSSSGIYTVKIEPGVSSIGGCAFSRCRKITTVIIPDSVTSIGKNSFYDCDSLGSVTIPDSVTSIGDYAFAYCDGIEDMSVPNGVAYIGNNAFYFCLNLTSVTIPDSVTSIGEYAFAGCKRLVSMIIPDGITSINYSVFYSCASLTSVIIPDSVTSIGEDAFGYCTSLTSVIIPDSVTSIGNSAFWDCDKLTSITIPDSLTSIGEKAFNDCNNLTGVYITDLSAWLSIDFSNCLSNPLYYAENLYLNGALLTELIIPDGVTCIKSNAFYGCSSLTSVAIPSSVTSIGTSAFGNCNKLTGVYITDLSAWLSIDFSSATSNPLNFAGKLYLNGALLTKLIIPDGITEIKNCAFCGCDNWTSVTIPDCITSIGDYAFSSCTGLTSVSIPNSVETIGRFVFAWCNSLTSVTIPDGITSIGDYAFYSCSGLTSVSIPSSVGNIDTYVFARCNSLSNVTISDGITSIGNYAFYSCTGLKSVKIPSSVKTIVAAAFKDCSSLTSVTIPDSVEFIGDRAFYGCSNLTDVYYGGSEEDRAKIYIINSDNPELIAASWHYNSDGPVTPKADYSEQTAILYTALAKLGYSDIKLFYNGLNQERTIQTQYSTSLVMLSKNSEYGTVADFVALPNLRKEQKNDGQDDIIWDNVTDADGNPVTYQKFYTDVIGDYKLVAYMDHNGSGNTGFYGCCYQAPDGTYVICYRGSEGIRNLMAEIFGLGESDDDWNTDFQFGIWNKLGPQFEDAMAFYNDILDYYCDGDQSKLILTGHSLGGALAAYVSLRTNTKAITFDGADGHIIDLAYLYNVDEMDNFDGTDNFNFINYTDYYTDYTTAANFAGLIQEANTGYYPMITYQTNPDTLYHTTDLVSWQQAAFGTHHQMSFLKYDAANDMFSLYNSSPSEIFTAKAAWSLDVKQSPGYFMHAALNQEGVSSLAKSIWSDIVEANSEFTRVMLGTSGSDTIEAPSSWLLDRSVSNFILGGGTSASGYDRLTGYCANDVLQLNHGSGLMKGGNGWDTYIVCKDTDTAQASQATIVDPSGIDDIYLKGFGNRSAIDSITRTDGWVVITFKDSEQTVKISTSRKKDAFGISLYLVKNTGYEDLITDDLLNYSTNSASSGKTNAGENTAEDTSSMRQIEIRNSNSVSIYDADGNLRITYTIGDEDVYADYGQITTRTDTDGKSLIEVYSFEPTDRLVVSGTETADIWCYTDSEGTNDDAGASYGVMAKQVDLSAGDVTVESCETPDHVTFTQNNAELAVNRHTFISKMTMNENEASLKIGETLQLSVEIQPADVSDTELTWTSGNESVAAVDENGLVTAVGCGTVQITAEAADGSGVNTSCIITIDHVAADDGEITEPTCTDQGYTTYTCVNCGITFVDPDSVTDSDPDKHVYEAHVTDPTCTEQGYTELFCACCGSQVVDESSYVDALGHDYTAVVTAPTCTEGGYTTYTCSRCGDSYKADETAADHSWNVGEITTPATTTTAGVKTYTCTVCGETKTEAIPATGEPTSPFTDVQNSDDYFYEPVIWAAANGIVYGVDDTHFAPYDTCTRAQVVTFLYRAAGEPAVSGTNPFVDVKSGDYYYEAVLWGYQNGIVYGTGDTTFSPDDKVTRAQFITFLYRFAKEPAVTDTTSPFKDLPSGEYYTDAVLWGYHNGIVYGTDEDKFSPDATCTRGQVVTFLHRYMVK